jgi:formylglycine-generating enzyme required for sulfatase activity
MEPVTIGLISAGLALGLQQVVEKLSEVITDPLFEPAKEQIKERVQSAYRQAEKNKKLHTVVQEALKQAGAPATEGDELLAWLKESSLDRLSAEDNDPLRRQLARAVLSFTDPRAEPPEDLRRALRWPRSRQADLAQFLTALRVQLASLDEYKDLLAYADHAAARDLLQKMLAQSERLGGLIVQTPAGEALRVAVLETGLSPEQEAAIENSYRERIAKEFRMHAVQGLAQVQKAVRLPLQDIYLELGLAPLGSEGERHKELERMLVEDDAQRLQREMERIARRVSNTLVENPRLVITGKPGSGKTFTLRFVALSLALGEAGAARLSLGAPYLPILVRLADYADRLRLDSSIALETFLIEYIQKNYPGMPHQGDFLQLALQKGACMVLLDGLDEVGDIGETPVHGRTLRGEVLRQVRRFADVRCEGGCGNRLVVTSRLEGYHLGDLPGFTETELTPLRPPDEVEDFLLNWFTAFLQAHDAGLSFEEARARACRDTVIPLMKNIMGWESVRRLAINPLLLTILAIIHEMGKRLPNRRVELYQVVARTMVENWRQAQTGHTSKIHQQLDADKIYYILASLAYWLHEQRPGGAMPRDQWQARIMELLKEEVSNQNLQNLVESLLRYASDETGLITERSPGMIGFFHLTLEEYLAAVEMARKETDERLEMLEKHWADPRWQEVILLTAGELGQRGNQRALQAYLHGLLDREVQDSQLQGLPALLAGRSLADVGVFNPNNPAHHRVRDALLETMQDLDPHSAKPAASPRVPARRRADAADALDELGWLPPDLPAFVRIDAAGVAKHGLTVPKNLALPFYIARYPLTNAQYARFLEAKDYADPLLWTGFPSFDENSRPMRDDWGDAGWRWLQSALQDKEVDKSPDGRCVLPRFWNDPRFGIARRGVPVVGLTWYEANACCCWLLRHWGQDEKDANPGWTPQALRLPAEAEWALAAGGAGSDRFPWDAPGKITESEDEITRRANVNESRIGCTTPVGMYPLGVSWPFGLWDLAGNVFEWQANFYDKGHKGLSLRGGSWNLSCSYARVALRNYVRPDAQWYNRGFRVVASPS